MVTKSSSAWTRWQPYANLERVINTLPPSDAEDGLTTVQVADRVSIPLSSVVSALRMALQSGFATRERVSGRRGRKAYHWRQG